MKTTFDPFLNSVRSVDNPPSGSPPALSGTNVSAPSQPGVSGAVDSVNGQTGAITLTKSDLSLGNVDNTSDANKPVSTATQTALDAKQDTLVSATNIKTVNGSSILGSGDLSVSGGLTFAQTYSITTLNI